MIKGLEDDMKRYEKEEDMERTPENQVLLRLERK